MKVLETIVANKKIRVATRKKKRPHLFFPSDRRPPLRSLKEVLRTKKVSLICEAKKASPSSGMLRQDYDPLKIAQGYQGVADAMSVITEEDFFHGSLDDLRSIRERCSLPLLMKDFVIDPYQLLEAREAGADAVLLIASIIDRTLLRQCLDLAREIDLEVLVEIANSRELDAALGAGCDLIGINNRDLRSMEVSFERTRTLAPSIPFSAGLVSESGILEHADLRTLRGLVDAFLIGTALMKSDDPARKAREIAYGRVKVCGLLRARDAKAAASCGATYGGLNFVPGSPRKIGLEEASMLRRCVDLKWVGVFADERPEVVERVARDLRLGAIQLHGHELPPEVERLQERLGDRCEVWKAWRAKDPRIPTATELGASRLIVDSFSPGFLGGTGRSFQWSWIDRHPERQSLIIAGGINPKNAAEADSRGAFALDINSGVESSPGEKDPVLLKELFASLLGFGRREETN